MNSRSLVTLSLVAIILLWGLTVSFAAHYRHISTFKDLIDPTLFRSAQFGMKVESAKIVVDVVKVRTTGAVFTIDTKLGTIQADQRIGKTRNVAQIRLGTTLTNPKISDRDSGFVMITFDNPDITIRINGDSLLMIQPKRELPLRVITQFQSVWNQSWRTTHLSVDEVGGISSHLSSDRTPDGFDSANRVAASCTVPAGEVYCLGVCPPKPYDWKKSTSMQVNWHWSEKDGYPTDTRIKDWVPGGNILLAQSEVMLWKDWNLAFIPRKGEAEFQRMMTTAHANKMRVIVYTSPFFFLKGTSQESQAVNDKPGICPGAVPDGSNMPLFLREIEHVMRDYAPDGLYFDGQYNTNPAALYALARYSRQIVGEKGLLEWHSSLEVGETWGGNFLYFPHADAYVDMLLRGEGLGSFYNDFNWLRYFVSGYNVHNSVGVICNNANYREPSAEMVENMLKANVRFHTLVNEISPATPIPTGYERRLKPDFQKWVDAGVKERYEKANIKQ